MEEGNHFDYREVMTERRDSPKERVLQFPDDLQAVYEETMGVKDWFTLGLLLNVEPHVLEAIDRDSRESLERMERIFISWLDSGQVPWFSLTHALRTMELGDLVNSIAVKKGLPLPEEDHQLEPSNDVQQRLLQEKIQQLSLPEREVDHTQDRYRLLKKKLSDLHQSSQKVAMETALRVKEGEQQQSEVATEENCNASTGQEIVMKDINDTMQVTDEVKVFLNKIESCIHQLEKKLEMKRREHEELNEEVAEIQKEVEKCEHELKESQDNCLQVHFQINAQRVAYNIQMRQQLQSTEKSHDELRAEIERLKSELEKEDESPVNEQFPDQVELPLH